MNFMSDGDETESEYNMVDEGAIAVMSMDEIRNMKNMQIDYERKRNMIDSAAFVKRQAYDDT